MRIRGKRGALSWNTTGEWILLLVILLVIVTVFIKPMFPKTQEFLNLTYSYVTPREFTPYQELLSDEEKTVHDSMKALQCAIHSTALGKPMWETDFCDPSYKPPKDIKELLEEYKKPEGKVCCEISSGGKRYEWDDSEDECEGRMVRGTLVTNAIITDDKGCIEADKERIKKTPLCKGILYSDICIECEKSGNNPFTCSVKGFELPQPENDPELQGWNKWIRQLGDPKFIAYHEAFPEGEEASWQRDAMDLSIKWMVVSAVLNVGPIRMVKGIGHGTGKLIGGTYRFIERGAKRRLTSAIDKFGMQETTSEALEAFNEGYFGLTRRGKVWNFFKNLARIGSIELTPREHTIRSLVASLFEGRVNAKNIFERTYLDLDDIATRFSKKSSKEEVLEYINRKLIRESADGKTVKTVISGALEADEKIAKEIASETNSLRGMASTLRQQGKWKTPEEFYQMVAERNVLMREMPVEFKAGAITKIDDVVDEDLKKRMKDLIEEYKAGFYKRFGDSNPTNKKISDMAKEGIIDSEVSLFTRDLASEISSLSRLTEDQLRSVQSFRSFMTNIISVDDAGNVLNKVDREILDKALDDSYKVFPEGRFQKRAAKAFRDIAPGNLVDEDGNILRKVVGGRLDNELIELEQDFVKRTTDSMVEKFSRTSLEGMWINTFGDTRGFTDFMSKQIPFSVKHPIIGTTGKIIQWPVRHRYFTLAALWIYSGYMDSMDEKYRPKGINTLYVNTPHLAADQESAVGRSYDLKDPLTDYYLNMEHDSGSMTRFFLASPCKANLKLTKTFCNCGVVTGSSVIRIGDKGSQPVKEGSAHSDNPEYWYSWDHFSEERRNEILGNPLGYPNCKNRLDLTTSETTFDEFIRYLYGKLEIARNYIKSNNIPYMDLPRPQSPKENKFFDIPGVLSPKVSIPEVYDVYIFKPLDYYGIFSSMEAAGTRISWKFLEDKPPYTEFKEHIKSNYIISDQTIGYMRGLPSVIQAMYSVNKKTNRYDDFFKSEGIMINILKDCFFRFKRYKQEDSYLDYAIKECNMIGTTNSIENLYTDLNSYFVAKAKMTAPCINIDADLVTDYGQNYCYTGSSAGRAALQWVNFVAFIGIDTILTGISPETYGASLLVLAATGAAQDYIHQKLSIKWPDHK